MKLKLIFTVLFGLLMLPHVVNANAAETVTIKAQVVRVDTTKDTVTTANFDEKSGITLSGDHQIILKIAHAFNSNNRTNFKFSITRDNQIQSIEIMPQHRLFTFSHILLAVGIIIIIGLIIFYRRRQ